MKNLIQFSAVVAVCLFLAASVAAQDVQCPQDRVCLTVEQARQALKDADTVKIQEKRIADLEKTVVEITDKHHRLEIETAKMLGDKTGAEQMIVRLTAIIDFMLKNGRTKKYGLINF
jgi:hypothetical protein